MRKLGGLFILVIATISVVALVLLGSGASAEDIPPVQLGKDIQLPPKPKYPRLDSQLNRMVKQASRPFQSVPAEEAPSYYGVSVAATIRLSGNASAIAAFLGQRGATVANLGVDYIEAYVPVALLPELEGQPGIAPRGGPGCSGAGAVPWLHARPGRRLPEG